ncbi:DNA polymerase III subunit delta [Candidatus Pelagibacter sp.]|nr:DNA polymerase III subunit delta [Candidatus Pelagibacter sp.]
MIIKSYELEKKTPKKKIFLFYGENQGYKKQVIDKNFKKNFIEKTYYYEETEVLNNKDNFFNNILSKSFFENEKLIIINRATDKIKDIIEEILEKNIDDLILILNADILEKKSTLRSLFEKNKETICVAFYEDTSQTLSNITLKFFRENKIEISQQAINLITARSRGDRQNLKNELEKIKNYIGNKNKIELADLLKLTNLAENYSVSELIDSCLSKNLKKTINILNENNYSLEDCILIIRTFLIKSKRLVKLSKELQKTKNVDQVILGFKPPIFWKDKETIKLQLKNWSYKNAENLSCEINDIELLIKKHSNNSINILSNFIIEKASKVSN